MPDIQKVSVALTGEQIAALKAAVETGEYATTSEIIGSPQGLAVQARVASGGHSASGRCGNRGKRVVRLNLLLLPTYAGKPETPETNYAVACE